jgi:hypothetical protein
MDAIINYHKVSGFLKKTPPQATPRFYKHPRSQKSCDQSLSQLYCPQSAIHGWDCLAVDPATYQLLKGTAFVVPIDLDPTAIYP